MVDMRGERGTSVARSPTLERETIFHWYRSSVASDRSYAEVKWKVPKGTPAGTYRISHSGTYLDGLDRKYYDFTGASGAFAVVEA